ncbi:hypothetical protein LguiB_034187 [Lonicera macranthoides]
MNDPDYQQSHSLFRPISALNQAVTHLAALVTHLASACEAVAYGAAVQGGILSGEGGDETKGVLLLDVATFTLDPMVIPVDMLRAKQTTVKWPTDDYFGGAKRCFSKPPLDELNLDHLNAAINYDGPDNVGPSRHPRSAHVLLNYIPPYASFSSRTNIVKWVGAPFVDKDKYNFFRDHNIVNPWVTNKNDGIRRRILAGESPDLEFSGFLAVQETRGKWKKKKSKRPAVEVVFAPPVGRPVLQAENTEGVSIAEPSIAIPISRRRGVALPVSIGETKVNSPDEEELEEVEEPLLRKRSGSGVHISESSDTEMAGRRSVLDSLNARLYKDMASGSSANPPTKRRKVVHEEIPVIEVEEPVVEETHAGVSFDADVERTGPPEGSPPPVEEGEKAREDAEHVVDSSPHLEATEAPEDFASEETVLEDFVVKPRIAHDQRPVNIKDSALTSSRVAHSLASAMILPEDGKKLESISLTELEYRGFQCQVGSNQYFAEMVSRHKQARKDFKAKVAGLKKDISKAKKEADEAKAVVNDVTNQLSSLQADYHNVTRSAEESKTYFEGQAQVADLQNSLKLAQNSKAQAVSKAREEEKRAAEAALEELKSLHFEELTKAETAGYNEASDEAADQITKIKDMIYKAGYELGLSAAGVVEGDSLFDKPVLCPPNLFGQPPPVLGLDRESDDVADEGDS